MFILILFLLIVFVVFCSVFVYVPFMYVVKFNCVYVHLCVHGTSDNNNLRRVLSNNVFDIVFIHPFTKRATASYALVFQIPCEDRCLNPQTSPEARPCLGVQIPTHKVFIWGILED